LGYAIGVPPKAFVPDERAHRKSRLGNSTATRHPALDQHQNFRLRQFTISLRIAPSHHHFAAHSAPFPSMNFPLCCDMNWRMSAITIFSGRSRGGSRRPPPGFIRLFGKFRRRITSPAKKRRIASPPIPKTANPTRALSRNWPFGLSRCRQSKQNSPSTPRHKSCNACGLSSANCPRGPGATRSPASRSFFC